jgi:hypothetical protein
MIKWNSSVGISKVIWAALFVGLGVIWYWPCIAAAFRMHQHVYIYRRNVSLPFRWSQEYRGSSAIFYKPGPSIDSLSRSEVRLELMGSSLSENPKTREFWLRTLGIVDNKWPSQTDATSTFASLGLDCGLERASPNGASIAFGCLSPDSAEYYEFTGNRRDLDEASEIVRQLRSASSLQ